MREENLWTAKGGVPEPGIAENPGKAAGGDCWPPNLAGKPRVVTKDAWKGKPTDRAKTG